MQTPEALLDAVESELVSKVGETVVSSWFQNARAVAFKEGRLYIAVPTTVERNTLNTRFFDNVKQILSDTVGEEVVPEYMTEEEAANWSREHNESAYANYTFQNFIVGPSNKFAHAAAVAIAETDTVQYNPLFIYGPPGLGKTHLLYAIAGAVKKRKPDFSVVYIKCETMMNELISALKTGLWDFREKYRSADLLLVDDVQFLIGKGQLQEEFFHTFNVLHEAGKQIVLTADKPARDLAIAERLISRFEMGLNSEIESPDLETRIALVEEKSRALGFTMNRKITEYIAASVTNNVRELEGAVRKISAMHNFLGMEIDLPMAQQAIKDLIKERPGLHPTMPLILSCVSEYFSVPEDKILSNDRSKDIVPVRQIACYLMKEMAEQSLPAIGNFMGLHHTTVMYGINTITKKFEEDPVLLNRVKDLRQQIENK